MIDVVGFCYLCYDLGVYYTYEELIKVFDSTKDHNEYITLLKFFHFWKENEKFKKIPDLEERIQFHEFIDSFRRYDADNSGALDVEEFTFMYNDLGFEYSEEQIKEEIKKLDVTCNGLIEFQEWMVAKGY